MARQKVLSLLVRVVCDTVDGFVAFIRRGVCWRSWGPRDDDGTTVRLLRMPSSSAIDEGIPFELKRI